LDGDERPGAPLKSVWVMGEVSGTDSRVAEKLEKNNRKTM
jgi:hypothetical protein